MLGLLQAGLVRVLAADPKVMELAYGRPIFDTCGQYAADPAAIVAMLEDAVTDMQARAAQLAGKQRDHTPTTEFPFVVVVVDEVAFLTAYQPDKQLRERVKAALATLTTQGRAVGYCVVAALQDPRKEVMSIRNLFPDRIAMRLDEPEQVDMVLGDGARDRGATADLISTDPATGAGVAFVRLESRPRPGAGPRRLGLRRGHPGHGRAVHRRARARSRAARDRGGGRMNLTPDDLADRRPVPVLRHRPDGHRRRATPITLDCPLCGWSSTWTGDHGTEVTG